MAQKTIPQLDEATEIDENALVPFDSGTQSYKIAAGDMAQSLRGLCAPVRTVSTGGDIEPEDETVRVSGAITRTMPDATLVEGREYLIKKTDSGTTTTIDFSSGQTADGESSLSLTEQYAFYRLKSNGTDWDIVGAG